MAYAEVLNIAPPQPDTVARTVKPSVSDDAPETETSMLPLRVIRNARKGVGEVDGLDADEKTVVLVKFLTGINKNVSPNNDFITSLAHRAARNAAREKNTRIKENWNAQLQFDLFPTADGSREGSNGNPGSEIFKKVFHRVSKRRERRRSQAHHPNGNSQNR